MSSATKSKRKSGISFVRNYIAIVATICVINILISNYAIRRDQNNYNNYFKDNNPRRDDPISLSSEIVTSISNSNGTSNDKTNVSTGEANLNSLPLWIQEYISWHRRMRSQFPGQSIITDPNAPPILVRICLGLCGGLHDRLGQLPLDLYLANQTGRILLIKWIKPQPLEEFLIPPLDGIDWVFPRGVPGWGTDCKTLNECAKQVRSQPQIPGNIGDTRLEGTSFEKLVDDNIQLLNGQMKDIKAVTFQIMGHLSEDVLEKKLRLLGETDMIHTTLTFGNLFHTFFRPHPNVQREIDSVQKQLGLVPGEYTIAHCRVRHPKAYSKGERFNDQFVANADKLGLPFEGQFRDLAVDVATRAIACAATLPEVANHPIYFMADESELVRYVTRNLVDTSFLSQHSEWFADPKGSNATAKYVMTKYKVVARDQNIKNAHIDKNKGRPPEEYYGTFVDLYLGIQARCVSFGIGNYAMFATKISGTKCKVRYAREVWGAEKTTHKEETQDCSLP
jgi:hypothetical protein